MGGKSSPPPPPDYSGIAAASEQAAIYSFELGKSQLAWAKEQYAKDSKITSKVVDAALKRQSENDATARKDRARYERIFQPLEDDLANEAKNYGSDARRESESGRAMRDVSEQFSLARTAAQDRLESFGIDPSQTRSAALDVSARVQEATARAGAGTMARDRVDAKAAALRSEAINVGRGYPGQIAGQYGTAGASGQLASGAQLNQTASGANTMGTGMQWQQAGISGLNTWGNTLNMGYQNQLDAYKAEQESSSGWGSALGMIGGIGLKLATGGIMGAEGGMVPGPEELAAGTQHQGVPITPELSPSQGAATDDVPARVNVGEFIFPKDVMSWKGEEWAQKEIEKARKQKSEAGAKPQVGALPIERPAVNTANQAALPLG